MTAILTYAALAYMALAIAAIACNLGGCHDWHRNNGTWTTKRSRKEN